VNPNVAVGQASDDDLSDENPPAKEDAPLNKALEILKAKNG
jgi:hypothetical protein